MSGSLLHHRVVPTIGRLRAPATAAMAVLLALGSMASPALAAGGGATGAGSVAAGGGTGTATGTGSGDQAIVPAALGGPRALTVGVSMGAASEGFGITLAPGRRGLIPALTLGYSSLGGWSAEGLGWSLDAGRIERWRGDGLPTTKTTETFSVAMGGAGGELVDAGGGVYRAAFESVYREYRRDGDAWLLQDGSGVEYRFGGSAATRVEGGGTTQQWLLDRVRDPMGNTIAYAYTATGGTPYLSTVRYTGFEDEPGPNVVTFTWATRPDARVSYAAATRQVQDRRLASIRVEASGRLVNRYDLAYAADPLNGMSLLAGVTLVGADGTSRIPLRSLAYSTRTAGWGPATSVGVPDLADSKGRDTGVRLVDVDGDGIADVVDNGRSVSLGDGTGSFQRSAAWTKSIAAANVRLSVESGDYQGADAGVRLTDVNGDAKPDLLVATNARREIWLNTGTGWAFDAAWSTSLGTLCSQAEAWGDGQLLGAPTTCSPPPCGGAYGDFPGCTPKNAKFPPDCKLGEKNCYPAPCTPSDFGAGSIWNGGVPVVEPFALVDDTGDSKGVEIGDVNGDGLPDIVWAMTRTQQISWMSMGGTFRAPVQVRGVFLNTGAGWTKSTALTRSLWALTTTGGQTVEMTTDTEVTGFSMADVNGDGLGDLVRTLDGAAREVFLATGAGWERDATFAASLAANGIASLTGDRKGTGLLPLDANDDGLLDYLRSTGSGGTVAAWMNTGTGWVPSTAWAGALAAVGVGFAETDGTASGVTMADLDGNGLADIVAAKQGAKARAWLAAGPRSGLLATSTTALGERTSLTWGVSTAFDNRDADGIAGLPMALPVVTALVRSDGRGHDATTRYTYAGGRYEDGALRGFRTSTETTPAGLRVRRTYLQDEARTGRQVLEEAMDRSGVVRARKASTFAVVDAAPGVQQVQYTAERQETMDDPSAPPFGWSSRTTYDARLRAVETRRDLDLAVSGDDLVLRYTYAEDAAAGIWTTLATTETASPSGAVLASEQVRYDGLPLGQVHRGLPTAYRELAAPGTWLVGTQQSDAFGNVVGLTDRNGNTTTFAWDPTGSFRVAATDAEGRTVRMATDPRFGVVVSDTNGVGDTATRELDAFGRPVRETQPGDEASPAGTTSYAYSALDGVTPPSYTVRRTETAGAAGTLDRTVRFDALARVYRVEREGAAGRTIVETREYDAEDHLVAASRPFFDGDAPLVSTVTRDEQGRTVRTTEPDGVSVTITYRGAWIDSTDRNGVPTHVRRDALGNTLELREGAGAATRTTRYAYDTAGRLTGIVDGIGERTRITYDLAGRRTRLEDPAAGTFTYAYDGESRLVAQTAPDGRTTRFRYDRVGQLVARELPDGTKATSTYDAAGRVTRATDASGVLEVRYDGRGHAIERDRTILGTTYVLRFAYDSLDRPTRIDYPDGFVARYAYDGAGNLASVTDGDGRAIATFAGHNALGQVGTEALGNGATSAMTYDSLLRMASLRTTAADGTAIQALAYTYDPAGNITAIDDRASIDTQQFTFDAMGRLVRAVGVYGVETYAYDAIGSLLRQDDLAYALDASSPQRVTCEVTLTGKGRTGAVKGLKADNCSAATLAAISARTGSKVDGKGSQRVAYDANGNVTARGGLRYAYDPENRLVKVTAANGRLVERNVYDASGRRVIRETPSETTIYVDALYEVGKTQVSRHVYAGTLLVATDLAPRATVRFAAPGGGTGWTDTGLAVVGLVPLFGLAWMRRHPRRAMAVLSTLVVCLLVLQATTPPTTAASEAGQRVYYHANHLGSIDAVTDDKGHELLRRHYTPFGRAVDWSGAVSGPRALAQAFGGHRYDDATGLYDLGARSYDPSLGRFITADTVVADPLQPMSLHRYAFAADNPIRYVDPTGHSFWDWLLTALVFIVAIVLVVVTFGAASGLSAALIAAGIVLACGVVGAGIGMFAAWVSGVDVGSEAFWQYALIGAAIGAAIGAGIAALYLGPAAVAAMSTKVGFLLVKAALGAMIGGATGALGTLVGNLASGGSVDALFGQELFLGWLLGAGTGAAMGAISGAGRLLWPFGKAGMALTEVFKASGQFGVLGAIGMAYNVFQVEYAGIMSWLSGRATTWSTWGFLSGVVHGDMGDAILQGNTEGMDARLAPGLATMPMTP